MEVIELFGHLTGWWHGAIPSVAMLTVVHCYTYVLCLFIEWKIRDSRCHSEGCSIGSPLHAILHGSLTNQIAIHVTNIFVHFFLRFERYF